MQPVWLVLAGILAPVNWVASDRNANLIIYLTKPAFMLALIAWLWSTGGVKGPLAGFFVGALFGLAGDVLLLLPKNWFVGGLVAFLFGHVSYIAGFSPSWATFWPFGVPLAAALSVVASVVFSPLAAGAKAKGQSKLVLPILVYMVVLSSMALTALLTLSSPAWGRGPAVLAAFGGVLFLISDSLLAWGRFVRPLQHERFFGMAIYHLAQFGILVGAGWNYIH
jgi:uncharacterized membrane protein YhhN